jgi:hypothetical protein
VGTIELVAATLELLAQQTIQRLSFSPLSAQPSLPEATTFTYHQPSELVLRTCKAVPFGIASIRLPMLDDGLVLRATNASGGVVFATM